MTVTFILKGLFIGFIISVPLGPMGLLCIRNAIHKNWREASLIGLGIALADVFYASIAAFGIRHISDFLIEHEKIIHFIGFIILLLIGLKLFFKKPISLIQEQSQKKKQTIQDIGSAFIITASNPLTIIFFGSIFSSLVSINQLTPALSIYALLAGIFIGAMFWWASLAFTIQKQRNKFNFRKLYWVNKGTAILLILICLVGLISLI